MAVHKVAEMQLMYATTESKFTSPQENVTDSMIAQTDLMRQAVSVNVATHLRLEEILIY